MDEKGLEYELLELFAQKVVLNNGVGLGIPPHRPKGQGNSLTRSIFGFAFRHLASLERARVMLSLRGAVMVRTNATLEKGLGTRTSYDSYLGPC